MRLSTYVRAAVAVVTDVVTLRAFVRKASSLEQHLEVQQQLRRRERQEQSLLKVVSSRQDRRQ